jgi:hypothetical protein
MVRWTFCRDCRWMAVIRWNVSINGRPERTTEVCLHHCLHQIRSNWVHQSHPVAKPHTPDSTSATRRQSPQVLNLSIENARRPSQTAGVIGEADGTRTRNPRIDSPGEYGLIPGIFCILLTNWASSIHQRIHLSLRLGNIHVVSRCWFTQILHFPY